MLVFLLWSSVCVVLSGVSPDRIPPPYLVEHKSIPPNQPVVIKVSINIYESHMDFDTDTLTIFGAVELNWRDIRKKYSSNDYNHGMFDAGINFKQYKAVEKNLWIPGIKKHLQVLTYRSASNMVSDLIVPYKSGIIYHTVRFIMKIACRQDSVNFPYDTYWCWQQLSEYESNETLYYKAPSPDQKIVELAPTSKHNGHKILEVKSDTYLKETDMWDGTRPVFVSGIDFGFHVQRVSPRAISTIVVPIIVITLMDAVLFVFTTNMYLSASMLPAFCIHFEDMTFTNTLYEWPPIAIWFFARLLSSILCNLWRFLTCISSKNFTVTTQYNTLLEDSDDTQNTVASCCAVWMRMALVTWRRRAAVLIFSTIIFYGTLSVQIPHFFNKKAVVEPLFE